MTKKDYVAIASAFAEPTYNGRNGSLDPACFSAPTVDVIARRIADYCERQSKPNQRTGGPLFDRVRFLAACGVQS